MRVGYGVDLLDLNRIGAFVGVLGECRDEPGLSAGLNLMEAATANNVPHIEGECGGCLSTPGRSAAAGHDEG